MKDKVSELKEILKQKKAMEEKKMSHESTLSSDIPRDNTQECQDASDSECLSEDEMEIIESIENPTEQPHQEEIESHTHKEKCQHHDWKKKYEESMKANITQKEMYLRKAAEFENFKKRLTKEQEEQARYANEKILIEMIPILDSLEMTLSHTNDKSEDPVIKGIGLIHKQFLQALERCGVKEIGGQGEVFDPNIQEAIGTEKVEGMEAGKITQVHRRGYSLKGRVIRAAMVTVSE